MEEVVGLGRRQGGQQTGEGVIAALEIADHGPGPAQLLLDVVLHRWIVALVEHVGIVLVDGQLGQGVVIHLDDDVSLLTADGGIGNGERQGRAAGKTPGGNGVQGADGPAGQVHLPPLGSQLFAQALIVLGGQQVQTVPGNGHGEGVEIGPLGQLQDQTLRQVPGPYAGGVQHLHGKQGLLQIGQGTVQLLSQLGDGAVQIAPAVQTVHQIITQGPQLAVDQPVLAQLLVQILLKGLLLGHTGLVVGAVLLRVPLAAHPPDAVLPDLRGGQGLSGGVLRGLGVEQGVGQGLLLEQL